MIEHLALAALAGAILGASCCASRWAWSAAVRTRRRIRRVRRYGRH